MDKEKQRQIFQIRKLKKKDEDAIRKCYEDFDNLHFNPMKGDFIGEILVYGRFWGAFQNGQMVACTYLLPAIRSAFKNLNAYWEVSDLLDDTLSDYMLRGYVWRNKDYQIPEIYTAFCKLWDIQTAKSDKSKLLYCIPAHVWFSMERMFKEGFSLVGLRGLDNIVPNYIFIKETGVKQSEEHRKKIIKCSMADTKTISKLCEHKYRGFDIDNHKNILFSPGR